ncbi:hypothetical protein ACOMHN_016157 [Nucella lapillus]
MASGGWRVHPAEDLSMAGASAAVSTSGYGGVHMPSMKRKDKDKLENPSSLEQAYWSGMRKRMGLSSLDKEEAESEDRRYEQLRKRMALYVENNFHQIECMMFIAKPNQTVTMNKQLKCKCGEILSLHVWGRSVNESIDSHVHGEFLDLAKDPTGKPPGVIPNIPWAAEKHLQVRPTFTYGKMSFNVESSGGSKPAKYLRLSDKDSADACLEFMVEFWRIMEPNPPNLVISVVGGAKNFRLDGEMRDTFANGLIKGKFNGYYRASNMILHGQPVSLNPDHTHFIFVDDGMRNRYGGVADFRAGFERKLCTPIAGIQPQEEVDLTLVVSCGERTMNERQRKTLEDRVARAFSKNWGDKADEELKKVMHRIDECVKRDNLMIFFDLRREEDLDVAILSVLTKDELYQIMTMALKEDKMSFVRLLLNQGVSMKEYLSVPRLEDLYNSV